MNPRHEQIQPGDWIDLRIRLQRRHQDPHGRSERGAQQRAHDRHRQDRSSVQMRTRPQGEYMALNGSSGEDAFISY